MPGSLLCSAKENNNSPPYPWALVAFFRGALVMWECFTSKFQSDGVITNLTPEEKRKADMKTTNDDNEGALGSYQVGAQMAPNISTAQ